MYLVPKFTLSNLKLAYITLFNSRALWEIAFRKDAALFARERGLRRFIRAGKFADLPLMGVARGDWEWGGRPSECDGWSSRTADSGRRGAATTSTAIVTTDQFDHTNDNGPGTGLDPALV